MIIRAMILFYMSNSMPIKSPQKNLCSFTLSRWYFGAGADVPWTSGAVYTEAQRKAALKVIAERDAAESARLAALAHEPVPAASLPW